MSQHQVINNLFIFIIYLLTTIIINPTAPGDYVSTSLVLTFSPGTRRLTASVQTSNDAIFEGDETFEAVLSLPAVGSERITLRDERAAAVIEDNDGE